MSVETIEALVIGAGQAGIAASEHLGKAGVAHLVVERRRIAERWRAERWDSLVANGPAWHDRFPNRLFTKTSPDGFAPAAEIVDYLVAYAEQVQAPIRTGVEVTALRRDGDTYIAETPDGPIETRNVIVATGPFQKPLVPRLISQEPGLTQIHSAHYRSPARLPEGAALVIGSGSSGVQIADELCRAGRRVYLAVGAHHRPPRRYRGKDFVWWLGALGQWDARAPSLSAAHVTIAVSGARGGHTVEFRNLAASGVTLLGHADSYEDGVLHLAPDLAARIADGDANYLSILDAADAYVAREGLDFPEEKQARRLGKLPACVTDPILTLNFRQAGITSVVWATGYGLDFGWIKLDVFNDQGQPRHQRGVAEVPGLYFLGLSFLSRRASAFIWGVWHDAAFIADHIAARRAA